MSNGKLEVDMKKIIAIALLIFISRVEAQSLIMALKPLFACEEAIVADNSFLKNYRSELWPLISDDCASQMKAAQVACVMASDHNSDECVDIINKKLDMHYLDVVNSKPEED
jgi:hypothetical protein